MTERIDPYVLAASERLHRTLRDLVSTIELHSRDRGKQAWSLQRLMEYSLSYRDAVKVLEDIDSARMTPDTPPPHQLISDEPF